MNSVLQELSVILKECLDNERYYHSLGVSYTAATLAMKYGCDVYKAQLAGLIHDYAKKDPTKSYIFFCENNEIEINEAEYNNPGLLHAKIGAFLANRDFKITDPDVLSSITYHTTGKPDMSLLEKIIYIADYIEPGRFKQPNLEAIRKEAYTDIDRALLMILSDTMDHLKTTGKVIDRQTEETYLFYKGRN